MSMSTRENGETERAMEKKLLRSSFDCRKHERFRESLSLDFARLAFFRFSVRAGVTRLVFSRDRDDRETLAN